MKLDENLMIIKRIEKLAEEKTCIHNLNSISKIITTLIFLICVISMDTYNLSGLFGFIFYPIILIELSNIPKNLLCKRVIVTIPFCLFAGVSNLIFERKTALIFMGINITFGLISFISLIIKTVLCVSAVLILVATTKMTDLFYALNKMKVPKIIVIQLLFLYRYIEVILTECKDMYTAYSLRGNSIKGIKMQHMGGFIGSILLRSFDRAEEIYDSMLCKGFYGIYPINSDNNIVKKSDIFFTIFISAASIIPRLINISNLVGSIVGNIIK